MQVVISAVVQIIRHPSQLIADTPAAQGGAVALEARTKFAGL